MSRPTASLSPAAMQLSLGGFVEPRLDSAPRLTPFIKWPGGKGSELPAIAVASPVLNGRFIDPFVGGGSVLLAVPAEVPAWANDASPDLISLYKVAATRDESGRGALHALADAWDAFSSLEGLHSSLARAFLSGDAIGVERLLDEESHVTGSVLADAGPSLAALYEGRLRRDLPVKFDRMRQVQQNVGVTLSEPDLLANVEGALRAAMYMAVRTRYNKARSAGTWDAWRTADFMFLREFAYAAMFRFNASGEFNVPYGGITYNRKSLTDKLRVMFSGPMTERLASAEWRSMDFEPFLAEAKPGTDDFVFVDPPYDSDFSDYDNRAFGADDQVRLAQHLERLDAKVMVVIKDTPLIRRLYPPPLWRIQEEAKTYMWTIKSRNDREATHLTITNY